MTGTGLTNTINIQCIPTNWLWVGTDVGGTHGGSGDLPGILSDPTGDYIFDEDGKTILPD